MRLSGALGNLRRHSALWNALRNVGWLLRGVRVAPGGKLIVDGRLRHGGSLRIGGGAQVTVTKQATLEVGDDCWIAPNVEINAGVIAIGDRVSVQRQTTLNGDISVGSGCLLAPNVFVSSGHHPFRLVPWLPIREQETLIANQPGGSSSSPIDIGEDCWIGTNSVILPGVSVGRGAVIGAGAVVRHDVGPYEVVAGVPAKRVAVRLEFRPPLRVDAADEMQMPYLYSGFQQARAERAQALALHGGIGAGHRFSVALDAGAAREVWIEARCGRQGARISLQHGTSGQALDDHWTVARFPIAASGWCLPFNCVGQSPDTRWVLLVRSCGVT